ncbi:sigma-70 family RNA polymerase sigma factor [Luteolibacter sp. GHJ8]|jgi:RNA polymerase sigma-70 factor (ECF subfamily)|uniref:Sigma-70 family RNA polymerase sigma factor n=1 Tax=Luteolibacter rhizosphaerae TaxID=2989719 RepID=A0ABT3G946_9BACT|nr:sigma-70 family RNA polymerase sigma factor [Luteolibacter rhizosphaerae]MCW1916368.1 sigma-70 family RNA polymerase sigma factor [Luteolibacter rhizosphaerae]
MSNQPERGAAFSTGDESLGAQIEVLRPALKGYVLSLLPDRDACEDVVQETCLFLWDRRGEFEPGSNFRAWAFKAAWFKVLTHRREMQRRKLVSFSEDVLERISRASEQFSEGADQRLAALSQCVASLPRESQQLLRLRYLDRVSLTAHAKELGVKPNQIQKSLSRLRIALRQCIENRLPFIP